MKCPNCQRENETASRFCIFCGSPLPAPEVGRSSEAPPTSLDTIARQLQALQAEVHHLRELVTPMNDRLAALERRQAIPAPPPVPPPSPVVMPAPAVEAAPAKSREWEQILGGNWLARIGVLALIIGMAFLLKFAADKNWLGPLGWVILGIVSGLAMLGGGHFWRQRYSALARALSGGGIAVLYLSIFAAFATLRLISFYPAVILLFLVSAASAGLALRYESMALAIIGIFGAFIAPFIVGASRTAGAIPAGQGFQLLAYVMVVDLGVLALSSLRNWRWFTLLALLGSLAVFGTWHDEFGRRASLLTAQGSLTFIFLIFVGATSLFHIIWRRPAQGFDYALMVMNAAAYFGISNGLMSPHFREWMGGFSLLLSFFYGGLTYFALKRGAQNLTLGFLSLGIALVFLTIAIPVQLGDKAWTTIAWSAEGAVLTWLSFRLGMSQLRKYGYAVFGVMAIRLLFFDTAAVNMRSFQPVLNERFLAFLVSIAALYLTAYLLRQKRPSLQQWEKTAWSVYPIFFVAASFFSLWLLSFELWNFFDSRLAVLTWAERTGSAGRGLRSVQNLSLTALWAFYAAITLVIGIAKRLRPVRLWALGLLAVPILKVFVYDVFALELIYRIIVFIGLGLLLLASAYLYQRYSKAIRGFLMEE